MSSSVRGRKQSPRKGWASFPTVCAASQNYLRRGPLKAKLSKWAKNVFVEDTLFVMGAGGADKPGTYDVFCPWAQCRPLSSEENRGIA